MIIEMKEALLQIIMAGMGIVGFSLYFHIRPRNLPAGMIGGVFGWAAYLLVEHFAHGVFAPSFCGSFLVCVWSEIMARVMKAPVNVFMIPGLIPIIPGSGLYHTMRAVVDGDSAAFSSFGLETGLTMMGIVVGILASSVVFLYIMEWLAASKRQRVRHILKKREKAAKKRLKNAEKRGKKELST